MFLLKCIRVLLLILILWNIPAFLLQYYSPVLASVISYLTSGLFILYYVLAPKTDRPAYPFIILALIYFIIASINYPFIDVDNFFIKEFLRVMIVVVFSASVVGQTNNKELYIILLLGAISIFINAIVFPQMSIVVGRPAGFYINANTAGATCILGYGLSYGIKEKYLRIIGQMAFTFAGILTFSRTFIIIWIFLNLIAIYRSRKNMTAPIVGIIAFVLLFTFADELTLDKDRFSAFENLVEQKDRKTSVQTLEEGSRDETWAKYYDLIYENPWVGHGFMSFQRMVNRLPGVHNTYLMLIGESGIIPFLLIIGIYLTLFIKSLKLLKTKSEYINLTIALILFLLTSHTYFVNFYLLVISIYVYINIEKETKILCK